MIGLILSTQSLGKQLSPEDFSAPRTLSTNKHKLNQRDCLMASKFLWKLFSISTIAGVFVLMEISSSVSHATNAQATFEQSLTSETISCGVGSPLPLESPQKEVLVASTKASSLATNSSRASEEFDFNFSYAESDAAVSLFGCDCPACINALRQLKSQGYSSQRMTSPGTTINNKISSVPSAQINDPVQGHCWVNLQERATPEKIQTVLATLDNKEKSKKIK